MKMEIWGSILSVLVFSVFQSYAVGCYPVGVYRIDCHATLWHHMRMKILPPTLEKGGQGGFEMDGQPIESLSISLYPKGEVR